MVILYNKGGELRKWYGNNEYVLNWSNRGRDLTRARTMNSQFYLQPCVTWTFISSLFFPARKCEKGFLWDVAGSSVFPHEPKTSFTILSLMNSKLGKAFLDVVNPTLNYQVENILALPIHNHLHYSEVKNIRTSSQLFDISRKDWDSHELSWNFTSLPLLLREFRKKTLAETYSFLNIHWQKQLHEMRILEASNNSVLIEAYELQDELTPDVPLSEITLTFNPHFRYKGDRSDKDFEVLLLSDTVREFISYAVGCMFGRFSLDKPGFVLANCKETLDDYLCQVPVPTFPPDNDNVIPILDGDWFTDDISERYKAFLKLTFGEEHYHENLAFIEGALGRDIQSYFLREFYDHHVKMYKKRPIYWLFSSPKDSFNALVYMHRYQPDTVSIVLNDYLREFRIKLLARKSHLENVSISASASQKDKTDALKEIEKIDKILDELKEYEDEILYPLATRQIEIDLDDGVLVNYNKFGKALKRVSGLSQ